MIVDHHAQIVPAPMHREVQPDRRRDVPLALDHRPAAIHADDVCGGQFVPRQLTRVDEEGALRLGDGDVARSSSE